MLNYQKLIAKHFNFRKVTISIFSDDELKNLTMLISLFVGEKDVMPYPEKTFKMIRIIIKSC